MRRSPVLLVTATATLFALSGCASSPTVDLDAAEDWAQDVVAAESDGPGSAGTLSAKVGPDGKAAALTLAFEQPTSLVRIDVRCYDGDLDDVTATVSTAITLTDGDVATAQADVPCDREPHELMVDAADAVSVDVEATANVQTYLHATVIQELVIER